MPTLAINKRARFDYEILDTYTAGLVLFGHEVKSVRDGHINMKGAYVSVTEGELYLKNCHISPYKRASNLTDYDPERPRKLLLNKKEISKIIGKMQEKGLTIVPIKVYTMKNKIKLEIGIGKGKKKYDKRQDIKEKDVKRRIKSVMKQY